MKALAAGYTLLELVIVMAILALIAIAAQTLVPGASSARRQDQDALVVAFRQARTVAMRESRTVALTLSSDGRSLLRDGVTVLSLATAAKSPTPILFDAEGFSSGGRIDFPEGGASSITVEPITGHIQATR